mgnify:CR=1 FL=1
MNIIEVKNLSKLYNLNQRKRGFKGIVGDFIKPVQQFHKAVDNISFSVKQGEFIGFIGPNGSGKSTTIKMLTGVLHPTSGEISVIGEVPYKKRQMISNKIGVVFGQRTQLWWNLPVIESFELIKKIYRISNENYKQNIDYFDDLLNIKKFFSIPVRQLSLGQRMQCELVAAMLHNPEIIFLDEPTIGVDLVAKEKIRKFLLKVNKDNGTTIILTTHDVQDIEKMVKNTIILNQGKIVFNDSIENLKKYYSQDKVLVLEFEEKNIDNLLLPGELIKDEGHTKHILINKSIPETLDLLKGVSLIHLIKDITLKDIGIEQTIMNIYREHPKNNIKVPTAR